MTMVVASLMAHGESLHEDLDDARDDLVVEIKRLVPRHGAAQAVVR